MKLIWLAVAIAFAIGEFMTPTLTLVWFSIGAVILIFLSSVIESILIQIIIFALISTTLLVLATKKFVKEDKNYTYDTNLQAVLNKKALVKDTIPKNKSGLVILEGEEWTAISQNGEEIEKDETVEIIKIEGVKLIVRKTN
ncbi:MAG: NfeD family protein [Peptostreptococcaceae bacterium]